MITPILTPVHSERAVTNVFRGYNHNLQINDGEWYDTRNLTTEYAPLFSPRKKRGEVRSMADPGGIIEKDALYYIDNGILYRNGLATGLTTLKTGELKRLVSFGAYIIVLPDKAWYNTADGTFGSMEGFFNPDGAEIPVTYQMCHVDGTLYKSVVRSDTEPTDTGVEVWIQTAPGITSVSIKVRSASEGWVELNTVYTKLVFATHGVIPSQFAEMDAVSISGSSHEGINGSKLIYALGGSETEQDWIVVINQLDAKEDIREAEPLSISRRVPNMDYICESNNRLWGCFYGYDDTTGHTLNEIYCSALGDFKNWNRFAGISTDSWVGSVGSDGEWTGAINYLGSPTFFKENHIHVVSISPYGAHQIRETPCRGVQKGSDRSLRIVNETLYYKSRTDVCAYQGSFPNGISDALGGMSYYSAVAGAFGDRYYVSMADAAGKWALFVYDTRTRMWMREDELHAVDFAKVDDELYALTANNKLYALNGTDGAKEDCVEWSCETGIEHYSSADHKYLSRYDVRMKGEAGARIDVYMEYDSSGEWLHVSTIRRSRCDTVVMPIRPRRCDHLRMRLVGRGDVKIFSISRVLEVGSDV